MCRYFRPSSWTGLPNTPPVGRAAGLGLARALLPAVLALALAAGQAHAQSDTAPPTVWFVEADLSGHSIDVYLSEDVKNSAAGDVDESLISVRDGQSASAGSAGAFSISLPVQAIGQTSLIALDMTEAQRQAVIGMASPYMHLSEGAFSDPAGNPIAATAVEIDAVRDATAPVLRRPPVLDTDSGRVLLPFSEFIDASRLAPGGLHVRDGAGASAGAGQITMSSATLLTSSDTDTAVFVLGSEQLGNATSMSSPHLYVDANSVYDVSGNAFQPSAAGSAFTLTDAVPPSLESASLDDGTGALLIRFDETVDVSSLSLTRAHIRQDGIGRTAADASNSVTLEGAQVTTASDTDTVSVLLTEQQRLVAAAIASPLLNLDAGAVRDSFGNAIERSSAQVLAVPDTRGPSILVAEIDLKLFAIDVLFDENVKNSAPGDIDESLISVRDGRSAAAGSAGAFTITLPVGTSGSASLVALDIDEAQRQAMIGMASPHMHVSAGAFSDIAGNPIAATVAEIDAAPDTAAPELRRPPVLDIDSGRVILPFSEFIDASRLAPGGLHVRDGAGASAGAGQITMSSATLLTSSDTETVAFGLGPQQSRAAAGMSSPHLYVDANSVYDVSGNAFEAPASGRAFSVTDTGPQVLSSRAVKLDEIEVSFSEPVRTSGAGAPTGWTISGADANSAAVSSIRGIDGESLASTAVLVLSVGLADTAPDVTVSYSGGNVEDAGSNALADYSAAPSDGVAPTFSGRTEAPNRAVFETSEPVTQIPFPISAPSVNDQLSCANGSITPLANQDTITFASRDCTVDPSWSGSVEYRPDGLRDLAGNSLSSEDLFLPLDDGIAPSITGARATSATTVEVSFDESVKTSDLAGKGWSVSGADSASRTVDSSTSLDGNTLTLTLSGPLSGTAPDIALRYETSGADVGADAGSGSGDITDKASSSNTSFPGFLGQPVQRSSVAQYLTHPVAQDNALAARPSIPVSDGIAPQIASATATKTGEITVAFSEPVRMSGAGAPTGWAISGADSASVSVSSITGISSTQSGTTARLLLSGQLAGTAPDVAVAYSGGNVEDLAGNALAAYAATAAGDGIAPTFAARATAPDGITVTFSENLTVSDASARGWSISGADSASRLVVSSTTASDADSIVLTLDGDLADTAPDGVVLRYKTSAGDVPGDPGSGSGAVADSSGNPVQAASVAVSDGIAPTVTAEATALNKITVTFSEPLTVQDTSAQGWSISGADAGGLTVDASTATSVSSSIVLTLSGNLADTNPDNAVLQYKTESGDVGSDLNSGSGAITDLASNALAARSSIPISDGLAPSFEAGITGDRTVIIEFGEQVSGPGNLAGHWTFSHADGSFSVPRSLSVTSLSSLTGSMAIGLDRDMPQDISGLSVGYAGSAVSDASGNALPASSADVSEERRPAVSSIRATELDKIAVEFTSPVRSSSSPAALFAAWSVSGGDAASPASLSVQSMTSLQVLTSSLTLTLSSDLPDTKPDGVILAYDGSAATIESGGGKELEDLSGPVEDGISPTVTARATGLNRIAVTFSEPLTIQDTTAQGWSVSGTDAAGRAVDSSTAASSADSIVLTLDGNLADTNPDNAVLRYETSGADVGSDTGSGSGAVADLASNALEARAGIPISDGVAPTISATTALPNKVAYRFSEAVSIDGSFAIQTFRLSPGCATGTTSISTLASQNFVTFTSNCNISSSSSGSFLYDGRNVRDLAGNRPGAWVYMPIDDGVAPSITGARAASATTIQVTFDEDVSTSDTAGKGWSISGADSASRTVDSSTSLDGRTVTLTLSGPLPDTTPDIQLRYETSGADVGSDTGSGSGDIADKSSSRTAFPEAQDRPKQRSSVAQYLTFPDAAVSSPLASRASIPVADGIAPRIVSAEATKPDEITVGFSEAVRMSDTGAPTGWTISGTDAASVSVSSITGISSTQSGTTARLLLSGQLADTSPDIAVAYSGGNIEDIYDNALAAYSDAPSDGIAPTIASAQSGTLDTITVTFSENVSATGTSGAGGWTLSGADSGSLAVLSRSDISQTASNTLTLTLDGNLNDPIGAVTLNYSDGAGDVQDESDNTLASGTAAVAQDLAPAIASARVTGPGTAQIEYSEPVTAAQSDYASLVVGGQSRIISGLSGGATDTHTISFTGGDPLGTDATGSVSISAANITDSTNNALGTGALSQPLSDGQSPTVSARYTARDTVALTFSEPVRLSSGTAPTEWTVSGTDAGAATGASAISVITASNTDTSAALTLNGDLADKTLLDFTLSYSGGNIEDGGGNPLAAYSATPDDGIAPAVSSAKYTSRNAVELTFSEPVRLSSGSAPTGWTVSGADSGAATAGSAISVLTTSATATSATLTLDNDLADKTLLDFTLSYSGGNVEDGGGNELSAYSAKPDDGIAPKITSAKVTGPSQVTVTYSENAVTSRQHYQSPITVAGSARSITGSETGRDSIDVLTFGGTVGTDAVGSINVDSTQVVDLAGNALGTDTSLSVDLTDGQSPTISAEATALDQITVTFSENLSISDETARGWSVSGGDADGRTVDSSTAVTSGNTVVLTLGSDMDDTGPDGVVLRYKTSAGNVGSDADSGSGAIQDPSSNALEGRENIPVSDGIAPEVSSSKYTARNTVDLEFSEPVLLSSAGAPTGWAAAGADVVSSPTAGSAISVLTASQTATSATLTLDNDLADKTLLDFTLTYAGGNIEDQGGNALADYSAKPSDGFAPRISSAEITGPGTVVITYSESATAAAADYAPTVDGAARTVSNLAGSGTATHTVAFAGGAAVGTGAAGTVSINSTHIKDASDNALGTETALSRTLADGQAPTVVSTEVTGPGTVSATFSEPVRLSGVGTKPFGWAIAGADSNGARVDAVGGITEGASATVATLTLDGDIADRTNPAITVAYSGGNIEDTAGNGLAPYAATAADDGIAPQVSAAKYVGRDSVLVTFSEPVRLSSAGAPAGWAATGVDVVSSPTAGSAISVLTASATATSATLTLDNDLADKTSLDFTLSYSNGNIEDESDNALAAYSDKPSDGIKPAIASAVSGTLDTITVTFSENVSATGTSGAGGWTLSGADSGSLAVLSRSDISQTASNTLTLTLDGNLNDPIGAVTLNYSDGAGDVQDESDNTLASGTAAVTQDLAPTITSARVTGPAEITVRYSEAVTAVQSDYASLVVGGQARAVSGLLDGTTATHTITFRGGDPFGTDATGSVSINAPNITDATGNALGAGVIQQPLSDGQSPTVSAEYTARNSVALTFSEPVRLSSGSTPAGWTVSGTDKGAATGASSVSVITTSVTSTSATLTLNGNLADKTLLDFTLSYSGGNIEDDDGNALAPYSATPDDGIAPTVSSAKYTSRNMVDLEFSEPVRLSSGGAPTEWTVSGTDKGAAAAASSVSVITTSVTSTSTTLTLDGNLADKTLLDFTLAYAATGNIEDQGGNALAAYSATPDDGIAPKITSAKVTGPNQITVAFSEHVSTQGSHYSSIVVDGAGRGISGSQTGRTVAAVISFDGAQAGTGAAGDLTINAGQVVDDTNNALGTQAALPVTLTDGQAPTFTAEATGLDEITVTFSESLSISDETARGWSVSGADATGRTVDSSTPVSNGNAVVLTLSSDLEDTRPDGVLLRYEVSGTDVSGDPGSGSGTIADPASNALAAISSVTVSDGIAPEVSSSKYTARNAVELTFSEPVRLSSAGAPTGWTASGADVVSSPTAGSAITVLTASATATSATLTLGNNLADKTSLDFTLSYDEAAGNIEDESDNALARYSEKPDDGLAPRITSAKATGLDQITVTFSENMNISDTAAQGWSVSGTDAAGRTVDSSTAVSNGDTVVLTLNMDMDDTKPDGVLLQYKTSPGDVGSDPGSGSGAIADPSSNALAARQSIPVSDGIAPTATAEATALDRITVTFSEPVSVPANAQGWSISGTDAAGLDVTASTSTSSGLSTVLTLSGDLADTNPDNAVLRYKTSAGNAGSDADSGSGAIGDPDSNALAARQNMPVSDGLAPTASFALTDDRAITVSFSEPVSSPDNDASHWTISGADAAGLAVSSVSSLTSATGSMTVALDGDVPVPSADLKLAYSAGGTISDGASLVLAAVPAAAVQDDRRPSITSATAVDRDTIVVEFTRGVSSTNSASDILSAWSVSGGDAASPSVLSVQGASSLAVRTSSLTLTLSGSLPDTKPDGVTLSFDSTAASVSDTESRNMADASATVADGIDPEIESARIVGPTTIEIAYGESVTAAQADYVSATVDGAAAAVSGLANGSTDTHTVTFSTASPAGTGAAGSVSIDAAAVTDASGNALGSGTLVQALADGQKPTIASAKATSLDTIEVTFSESLSISDRTAQGWSVSGTDASGRTVDSSTAVSNGDTVVLTLNTDMEDTKPDGVLLRYETSGTDVSGDPGSGSGAVQDLASNALEARSSIQVSDGIAPAVESSKITGPNEITITYGEAVTAAAADYTPTVGTARTVSALAGSGTAEHTLTFGGAAAGTGDEGTVSIDAAQVEDTSNNSLGTSAISRNLDDGQSPEVVSVTVTDRRTLSVAFSEDVRLSGTAAAPFGWALSGTDADGKQVSSVSGIDTNTAAGTAALTLDGDILDKTDPAVTVAYSGASIVDSAGNALAAYAASTATDGIAPSVSSAKYVSRDTVLLTFSEPVKLSSAGAPTGWAVSGTDKGAATGAGAGQGDIAPLTDQVSASSATLTLNGQLADKTLLDFTLSYAASGNLEDGAGNGLNAYSATPDDGIAPVIVSAESRELNKITVTFSEAVTATGTGGAGGWTLSGADSNSRAVDSRSDISQTASDTLTLTLDGNLNDPIGAVTLNYSGGAGDVQDESDNTLASGTAAVTQDLAPTITRAEAISASQIRVTFSESVSGTATDADGTWKLLGTDSTGVTVTGYSGVSTADTVTLDISPDLTTTSPSLQLQYVRGPGDIQDSTNMPLVSTASPHVAVSDGIAPAVESAKATSLREITVEFSEALSVSGTGAQGWSVSGGDAAGRTVDSSTAVSNGNTMVLTLNTDMEDTKPDGVLLQYKTSSGNVGSDANSGSGAIADPSSNALEARANIPVSDGIAPTVETARITGPNAITVTYSEAVTAAAAHYTPTVGTARAVSALAGSGTAEHALTFGGDAAGADAAGTVSIDAAQVKDTSDNALGTSAVSRSLADGQSPVVASVTVTDRRTLSVAFSEAVQLSGAGAKPFGWALSGTDAGSVRVDSVGGITQSASASTATLALDGDIADTTSPSITVAYSGGNIADTAGNALAAYAATAAGDGIAPTLDSVTVASRNTIAVEFSEPVRLDPAGAPTGWTLSGADAASRAVSTIAFGTPASTATLTLNGNIADKTNPAVTVAYSGGNIEDAAGNDMAVYAAATATDGIAPTFTARATALDKIEVTFSEAVTSTGTSGPAGWSISGDDSNSRLVDMRSDISGGATTLVLDLSGNLADTKPDGVVLRYDPGAGDAADAAGNEASGTAAVSDGIAPTVVSAESREADKVTVTFSEPVSGTATAPGTTWALSGAGVGGRAVIFYGGLSESRSVELTVSSAFPEPIGAVTLTYASPPGDVADTAGNGLAGASRAVTQNLAPRIASAEATARDSVTITFTEAIRGTATDPDGTWKLGGADAGTITVSRYPAPSGTSVVLGLSGELPDTDPDLSLQYVRNPGDVEDLTGEPLESTVSPHVTVSDGLAPALASAALDEGTGVLTLTFTEAIDVSEMNESSISIREQGASSGGVALSASARTTAADSATVSFTLFEQGRRAVIAMATPQLDVSAGAVRDPDGNTIAASADSAIGQTPDTVAPQLQSATLDEGAGTIVLTFDENMSAPTAAQAARVQIGTVGSNISFAEADITSAELDSAGTTITITVSEAKRQEIIAATPSDIDVLSGGLRDVSGAEASSSGTAFGTIATDAVRPTLASAVLNTDDGVLVLSFSETMDASSFAGELAKVSVSAQGTPVRLAGTARADGTNVIVTLEPAVLGSLLAVISAAPNAGAPGLLSLQTTAAPQFADTSGNAVVSVSGSILIEDGRPPALVSAEVTSSDTIVVRFSEDLADNTVQTSDFEVLGYGVSSVSEMSGVVTITMANPDTFSARDAPGVRMAGPVSDLFGNALEPGQTVISVNRIMPAMISQFTAEHDGPATVGDQVRITLRTQDAISPELAVLRVNGQAVPVTAMPNGFDATYTVPAGAPQGRLALYVEIVSATGTPAEFSERHLTGPNVTIDTVPPSVSSSWISGADSVTLVYSEPVTASASDYTGIEADGGAPVSASRVVGSGGTVVTVSWPGAGTTPSSVRLTAGAVDDSAGNEAVPAQITADSAQAQVTLGAPGIPLARGTTVETITAPSGIEPVVDVSSLTGTATDAAVIAAGGGSAVFESELRIVTRTFGLPDATFPAGTQAGGLGPLTSGGAAFGEAITIASSSSTAHLSEDQRELYPLLFDGITATVQVGHPGRDIVFDRPVLLEFDMPLSNALVFSVGTLGVPLPIPACDPSWDASALPVAQSVPEGWAQGTYDTNACVDEDSDSVWTGHFSLFGVSQPPPRGGSECDDCTPPTLGYDAYGARLVEGGFSYNGLASDVDYFFTPYPLIESEVGGENTVVLRIYENEGPGNVSHAALAFGLRSGEVISESRAVINYDISFDGTGEVSAIDPDGAIDPDTLSAEHETVQCSPGSELQCLQITIKHTFRAPLEFDIVGTDVWDTQRNSWQNYYNHGIRVSGEPLDGRPGIEVDGMVLYPISAGSANRDVMMDSSGRLFKLSPEGAYMPLANQSRLYHDIDESMYVAEGAPMQGYGRSDPQFGELVYEQILRAQKVLSGMNAGEPGAPEPARAHEPADPAAAESRLREALLAEQRRAQILSDVLFGRRG